MTLAGHTMTVGPSGTACSTCGRTWLSMLDRRDRWTAGELGIAHTGALNQAECDQLNAEIQRIWLCVQ